VGVDLLLSSEWVAKVLLSTERAPYLKPHKTEAQSQMRLR